LGGAFRYFDRGRFYAPNPISYLHFLLPKKQKEYSDILHSLESTNHGAEEVWRRDPLPIAVHEADSLARIETLSALARQNRSYRIVYHSSSLEGQVAAVESGLAVAVLTRCSVPADFQILHNLPVDYDLPALGSMNVAVIRSQDSIGSPAVDAIYEQMLRTLCARS
jgi:DNA-binding transcriptional LysR family regulator